MPYETWVDFFEFISFENHAGNYRFIAHIVDSNGANESCTDRRNPYSFAGNE
jgi:hypothetical protein